MARNEARAASSVIEVQGSKSIRTSTPALSICGVIAISGAPAPPGSPSQRATASWEAHNSLISSLPCRAIFLSIGTLYPQMRNASSLGYTVISTWFPRIFASLSLPATIPIATGPLHRRGGTREPILRESCPCPTLAGRACDEDSRPSWQPPSRREVVYRGRGNSFAAPASSDARPCGSFLTLILEMVPARMALSGFTGNRRSAKSSFPSSPKHRKSLTKSPLNYF